MTCALDICNAALGELGLAPIPGIDAEGNDRQRMCARLYHPVRRDSLCRAVWRWACAEHVLRASGAKDGCGRDRFPLPGDALRLLGVHQVVEGPWCVQMRAIMCHSLDGTLKVDIIRDAEDLEAAPPQFCRLMVVRLALKLAPVLTIGTPPELLERLKREAEGIVDAVRPTLAEYRDILAQEIANNLTRRPRG